MNQEIFNEAALQRQRTPWGKKVIQVLTERDLKQTDLIEHLRSEGYSMDKFAMHNLLYGVGVSNRTAEITAINKFLSIPFENH